MPQLADEIEQLGLDNNQAIMHLANVLDALREDLEAGRKTAQRILWTFSVGVLTMVFNIITILVVGT